MQLEESIAAATAVVGFDLLSGNSLRQSDRPRTIVGVGLAGSAAALDTEVDIFVGQIRVGNIYNKATGAVTRDHMFAMRSTVPPNQEVHAYVVDAPATNPINILVDFA